MTDLQTTAAISITTSALAVWALIMLARDEHAWALGIGVFAVAGGITHLLNLHRLVRSRRAERDRLAGRS